MSQSNVGNRAIYEDGDQRNYKDGEEPQRERFHEGKDNSHLAQDSKDERSIANKLEREKQREKEKEEEDISKKKPTGPALLHGNEPSKGAKIDEELMNEEAEILKKKGGFGPKT